MIGHLTDVVRQRAALSDVGHRPWPLPEASWLMGQSWVDLLFAHWRVSEQELRKVIPAELQLDTCGGSAWLGITPFRVQGLRLRATLPAPGLSSFPELNVRTYVRVEGRPGIYFLSLDADSRAAVFAARRTYRLPYFHSRMRIERDDDDAVAFDLHRISGDGPPAYFTGRYGRRGEELPVREGSLERWLVERYCLYTLDKEGRVQRGEIHHPPWPLYKGWAEIETNTMAMPFGIDLAGEPLLHYSPRQDVVIWPLRPVSLP